MECTLSKIDGAYNRLKRTDDGSEVVRTQLNTTGPEVLHVRRSAHLESIMAAKQAWQLQQCSLGYRTPWDDDSDESVCSLPCGLHQIHPTGKQVWVTQTKHPPSLEHTHWFKHALPAVSTARCIININCPGFIGINTFHMVLASYETVLNLHGHNKSSRVLVLWSEKPQDLQLWVFVNMVCETLETAWKTTKDSSMRCGQRRWLIPPPPPTMIPLMVPLLRLHERQWGESVGCQFFSLLEQTGKEGIC